MNKKNYFLIVIFFLGLLHHLTSFAEAQPETQQPNYLYLPIPSELQNELNKNAAPPPEPSKLDYSFSNPNFTLQDARQIIGSVLPKSAQELSEPQQFYPLIGPCYANKLDKIYYHFLPSDSPKIAYLWFDDNHGQCQFASYYLGTLEKSTDIRRAQHCPINNLRYQYLFTPNNLTALIMYEKTNIKSPVVGEFLFRTETCLHFRPLTTEQLQSMFPNK